MSSVISVKLKLVGAGGGAGDSSSNKGAGGGAGDARAGLANVGALGEAEGPEAGAVVAGGAGEGAEIEAAGGFGASSCRVKPTALDAAPKARARRSMNIINAEWFILVAYPQTSKISRGFPCPVAVVNPIRQPHTP